MGTPLQVTVSFSLEFELKGEREKFTIAGGDSNTPHLVIDVLSRQKINKYVVFLNSAIHQFDLAGMYGIVHPTTGEHICFSCECGTFTKLGRTLGHKT